MSLLENNPELYCTASPGCQSLCQSSNSPAWLRVGPSAMSMIIIFQVSFTSQWLSPCRATLRAYTTTLPQATGYIAFL